MAEKRRKSRNSSKTPGRAATAAVPTAIAARGAMWIERLTSSTPLAWWFALAVPVVTVLWIWLSPLAFVPVPWPDDSAFYFVAHEFFKWPPRWVMLPQAPFEPTYSIYNFNTMPLYPILIGLGRAILGVDGSFALKIWPLGAFAAGGVVLVWTLLRQGLPVWFSLIIGLGFAMDPALRWSSVLVRPESLVNLFGLLIVLGMTFGFPEKLKARDTGPIWRLFWDPIAFLLALAAYTHFNAIHLLFPVVLGYAARPDLILRIGLRGALYMVPWSLTVLLHFQLFVKQMGTQWKRLAVPNGWLNSVQSAIHGLFQNLGSPADWPRPSIDYASMGLWVLILIGIFCGLLLPPVVHFLRLTRYAEKLGLRTDDGVAGDGGDRDTIPLTPSAAWVLGGIWLWTTKPEVWFVSMIHYGVWAFTGVLAVKLWRTESLKRLALPYLLAGWVAATTGIMTYVNVSQASSLGRSVSWTWDAYHDFIDCVNDRLESQWNALGKPKTFQVWAPTFPDITIELSRKHRDWSFTRTNDFHDRVPLAIEHGRKVDAVVISETLQWQERVISEDWAKHPEVRSVWADWDAYFLHGMVSEPGWKPNRYLCQRGRWQAFMYMNPAPSAASGGGP